MGGWEYIWKDIRVKCVFCKLVGCALKRDTTFFPSPPSLFTCGQGRQVKDWKRNVVAVVLETTFVIFASFTTFFTAVMLSAFVIPTTVHLKARLSMPRVFETESKFLVLAHTHTRRLPTCTVCIRARRRMSAPFFFNSFSFPPSIRNRLWRVFLRADKTFFFLLATTVFSLLSGSVDWLSCFFLLLPTPFYNTPVNLPRGDICRFLSLSSLDWNSVEK